MYRCEVCGTVVPPKEKARMVVLETREKVYPPQQRPVSGKDKGKRRDRGEMPGGRGWEIAREAMACSNCNDRMCAEKSA